MELLIAGSALGRLTLQPPSNASSCGAVSSGIAFALSCRSNHPANRREGRRAAVRQGRWRPARRRGMSLACRLQARLLCGAPGLNGRAPALALQPIPPTSRANRRRRGISLSLLKACIAAGLAAGRHPHSREKLFISAIRMDLASQSRGTGRGIGPWGCTGAAPLGIATDVGPKSHNSGYHVPKRPNPQKPRISS